MQKILHNRIKCKKCGDVIESLSVHDFKWCSCKACAVDGGREYLRRVGNEDDWEDMSETMHEYSPMTSDMLDNLIHPDQKQIKRMMQCLYCKHKPDSCGWDKTGENEKGLCLHYAEDRTLEDFFGGVTDDQYNQRSTNK